jgi:hypothetical protein
MCPFACKALCITAQNHCSLPRYSRCLRCACSGEENISIIVAPIFEGFSLSSLGTPQAAAQQFLDTIAAPAGSDKTAALVAAEQR